MKHEHAQAVLQVLKDGMPVETTLAGLRSALERKGHAKLFGPILLEVLRVLEADKGRGQAVVATASAASQKTLKSQIEAALKELGVLAETPVKTIVDETLVGGFVATFDYKEHDQTYKRALKTLFESITR